MHSTRIASKLSSKKPNRSRTPKAAKLVKEKVPKMDHPDYISMIQEAIVANASSSRKGVSKAAIANFITKKYFSGVRKNPIYLTKALKKAIASKLVAQKGPTAGWYKLIEKKKKVQKSKKPTTPLKNKDVAKSSKRKPTKQPMRRHANEA